VPRAVVVPGTGAANEGTAPRVQYAAASSATWTEKFDPNVPSVEEAIARDRDLLIINPDSLPFGSDRHREPVAGPARNLAREERTGTVQRIDIELRVTLN